MSRKGKSPLKIIIGTPTGGFPTMEFAQALWASKDNKYVVDFITNQSPRVAHNRNNLVRAFLESDADALLFIDDDMSWKTEALDKLVEHFDPKKRPVVGGLAFGYDNGTIFTTLHRSTGQPGRYVRLAAFPQDGLIEVDATGGACLLVARHVFERVAEGRSGYPWFQDEMLGDKETGEDIVFCSRVREAGFPIYVATGVNFAHIKGPLGITLNTYADHINRDKFLFTGTGRCGTNYMASVMSAMNIPTGHEAVFNPKNVLNDPIPWGAWRGDSSWLAAPYLKDFKGMVFHLVRHPLDVVSSLCAGQWFRHPGDYGELAFRARSLEPVYSDYPMEQAARFVVEWNGMIEPWAHYRIPIEAVDQSTLNMVTHAVRTPRSLSRIDSALERIPRDANKFPVPYRRLSYSDCGEWGGALKDLANRYGYRE